MSQLRMFEDSPSAIGSPASADGVSPCDSPGGQTTAPCGPGAAPASPSRQPVRGLASTMPATFGRRGFGSFASAALTSSLVSRLRAQLPTDGSIVFAMTWKAKATPSGRSICLLRALGRRTSDSVYGSWPTTTREDARSSARHGYMLTGNQGSTLLDVARLASWPTPCQQDGPKGGPAQGVDRLPGAAQLASWPSWRPADLWGRSSQ